MKREFYIKLRNIQCNKLKKLKSRTRSMVVWVMVRNSVVGGVGGGKDDGVEDGMDGVVGGVVYDGMDYGVDGVVSGIVDGVDGVVCCGWWYG